MSPALEFIDLSTKDSEEKRSRQVDTMDLVYGAPIEVTRRYLGTVHMIGVQALHHGVRIRATEWERWHSFLDTLAARVADGSGTEPQRSKFVSIWERAKARAGGLPYPAVGFSTDGVLRASWSFAHLPNRVFTLEVHRDGSVEWFHQDGATQGTEDAEPDTSNETLDLLVRSFGSGVIRTL